MGTLSEDLQDPTAFGLERGTPIELITTHISWVLRTPDAVFKVKRPVDLGFLDFRTGASRQRACEAEVALNRRLAPGVYRGVVEVRRDADGRHRIGGDGEVVDWAVHMERLPDEARADERLTHGTLGGAEIDRLADRLERFHRDARSDDGTSRFGAPEVVRGNIVENFVQANAWIGRYLTALEAHEIERFQFGFVRDRARLLLDRMAAGRVRDGHGDLRLEHVYLGPGDDDIAVIDCIEFSDRFRYADVCADLAFLAMDLSWHGRVDLAERLLARYARTSDDYDLYAVVDFYGSYRAFVRGKVAGLLAADADAPAEVRSRAEHDARRYFLLALAAGRRAVRGACVVAVGGVVATGKSTVAEALGRELGAPVVDADRTRKHLLGVAPTQPVREAAWSGAYDPAVTDRVYAEVLRRADVVLASGRPAILDASFRSAEMRAAARGLAAARGVPFRLVECRAPAEVCRARLRRRADDGGAVSDGRLEIFDDFCARFEPVTELGASEHVTLDTTRPIDACLATIRDALDADATRT